jgi:hypothetical protein
MMSCGSSPVPTDRLRPNPQHPARPPGRTWSKSQRVRGRTGRHSDVRRHPELVLCVRSSVASATEPRGTVHRLCGCPAGLVPAGRSAHGCGQALLEKPA